MAGKFLSLEEAAQQLGISEEKLKELREHGDIHGYRDGASWKFKAEEIERAAEELKSSASASSAGGGLDDLMDEDALLADMDLEDRDEESDSSILVSEVELGHSEESTSSTIIGRSPEEASPDSDLELGLADSNLTLIDDRPEMAGADESRGSDVALVSGSGTDSDVSLVADTSGESDLQLAAEDTGGGSNLGLKQDDDELSLAPLGDSNIELTAEDSSILVTPGSDVLSGNELELESPSSGGTGDLTPEGGSSGDLGLGSDILSLDDDELALGEDDDLVLGGSGTGSDVSLSAVDSGINLTSPSDSGLSLEDDEPLELGGSSISSLELPEDDDDIIALDTEMADPDETTQLKQDEEFLLSPSDELEGEESDSGSQVIALEDSEAFDEDAATMIQGGGGAAAAQADMFQPAGGAPEFAPQAGGQVQQQVVTVPIETFDTPYSIWNVLGLLATVMMLSLCGMLMTDVVRNIWSWQGASGASSSLMDALLSAFKF